TILVTSHILGEMERVADRVAILLQGRSLGVHRVGGHGPAQRFRLRVRGDPGAVRACLNEVRGVQQVSGEHEPDTDLGTYLVDGGASMAAEALAAPGFRPRPALLAVGPATPASGTATVGPEAPFLAFTRGDAARR